MEGIKLLPQSVIDLIPKFGCEKDGLNAFIKQVEYVLKENKGSEKQNEYLFHVLFSRLYGEVSDLVAKTKIADWEELKSLLSQLFGDTRTLDILKLELETLCIYAGEDYDRFFIRIRTTLQTLHQKLEEKIKDPVELKIYQEFYDEMAFNVFMYNLPPRLALIVRVKNITNLQEARAAVAKEENFQKVHNFRRDILRRSKEFDQYVNYSRGNNIDECSTYRQCNDSLRYDKKLWQQGSRARPSLNKLSQQCNAANAKQATSSGQVNFISPHNLEQGVRYPEEIDSVENFHLEAFEMKGD